MGCSGVLLELNEGFTRVDVGCWGVCLRVLGNVGFLFCCAGFGFFPATAVAGAVVV